ncbi:hypothetical protein JAAARDRAFT_543907 [Jaapia argillacea MUCL 33604]|uniref:hAT-like transposase RNase-H fold domain-containing protein n=1 Tax=Jaapia argillacea MUCL 33604 TaxID=933084 RepID=A0A067PIZ9_9AGAM|nr:hypothetical protein JAAARDRAFT_543907 [Jaapia argillacea MUCL 33604]
MFQRILECSDRSQQRCSSDQHPALHLGLPALEDLHTQWSALNQDSKVNPVFKDALQAGLDKIAEYYDKTGNNDAYVFSMILDPSRRYAHFKKHWSKDLQDDVDELAQRIERYNKICGPGQRAPTTSTSKPKRKMGSAVLADLSSDEDGPTPPPPPTSSFDTVPAWKKEFHRYLDLDEDFPESVDTVEC